MHHPLNRRRFLQTTAAAVAAPLIVPSSALGLSAAAAPGNRINLGFIGAGNMNNGHITGYLAQNDVQIVAVCDPMSNRREATRQRIDADYAKRFSKDAYRGCAAYNDFRDLIADINVDAVSIAVPDHWHVIPALAAARAGKDVYLEKPSTLTIDEGRVLVETIRRYGRIFQHGTQQRSYDNFRFAAELARNRRIGRLHTVIVGSPGGASTGYHAPQPVPPGFDYELWLGPAPWAPYCPIRVDNAATWIFITDYSGGHVTGWGIHHVDCAQWGMGTDATGPVEVEGTGVFPADGLYDTPVTWKVECRYANGMKMIYGDTASVGLQGVKYIGTEGWVHVDRGVLEAEPKGLLNTVIGPNEIHLYRSGDSPDGMYNHHENFLHCIRSRGETICPVEIAHRSTTICHLTNICLWLGRKVRWNPDAERFVNDPEADRYYSRAKRSPWRL
jgi:predicted dehydrogenase